MALEDFKKHMKHATIAAAALAATARVEAQQLQTQAPKDAQKAKTEQVAQPNKAKEAEKTINFFDVAKVSEVKEDGEKYHIVDDAPIPADMLKERALKREFKKDEKTAWKEAEQDRIFQDTVNLSDVTFAGTYSADMKRIDIPYINNDLIQENPNENNYEEHLKGSVFKDVVDQHNDVESLSFKSLMAHEEQHRSNDKLGIYAPGLSAEQYAVLNQYDEISCNIAGLNVYVNDYKEQIKSGVSKEEALKVFDLARQSDYKQVIADGVDPDSKEGRAKLVGVCFDDWKNSTGKHYQSQIEGIAIEKMDGNSFQALTLGNDKELDKRIEKVFNNIAGGKSGELSEFLPSEKLTLTPTVENNLAREVEQKIGLSKEDRNTISSELDGKSYKKQARALIKSLTGRGENKNKPSSSTPGKQKNNEIGVSVPISPNNVVRD